MLVLGLCVGIIWGGCLFCVLVGGCGFVGIWMMWWGGGFIMGGFVFGVVWNLGFGVGYWWGWGDYWGMRL